MIKDEYCTSVHITCLKKPTHVHMQKFKKAKKKKKKKGKERGVVGAILMTSLGVAEPPPWPLGVVQPPPKNKMGWLHFTRKSKNV